MTRYKIARAMMMSMGAILLLGPNSFAAHRSLRKALVKVGEHLALGAVSYEAVSRIGSHSKPDWQAGLTAVGIMAAVKEGSDVVAGRDTIPKAILHATEILAGGGIVAAVDH